jgi:hypothetical protein
LQIKRKFEECHVAFVRNDVSRECITYIIRGERISKLGKMLAVTSN